MAPKKTQKEQNEQSEQTEQDEHVLDEETLQLILQLSELNLSASVSGSSSDTLLDLAQRMQHLSNQLTQSQKKMEKEISDRTKKIENERNEELKKERKAQETQEKNEKMDANINVSVSFTYNDTEHSTTLTIPAGAMFADLARALLNYINRLAKQMGAKKVRKDLAKKFKPIFNGTEYMPRKLLINANVQDGSQVHFRFPDAMAGLLDFLLMRGVNLNPIANEENDEDDDDDDEEDPEA